MPALEQTALVDDDAPELLAEARIRLTEQLYVAMARANPEGRPVRTGQLRVTVGPSAWPGQTRVAVRMGFDFIRQEGTPLPARQRDWLTGWFDEFTRTAGYRPANPAFIVHPNDYDWWVDTAGRAPAWAPRRKVTLHSEW